MRKEILVWVLIPVSFLFLFTGCEANESKNTTDRGVRIIEEKGNYTIHIDGKTVFMKGICGTENLEEAVESGANSLRTWDAENIVNYMELARKNNMYVLMGITLSKSAADYNNESYKNEVRKHVETLVKEYKDDPLIFAWALGNEINIKDADNETVWGFVEELAKLIKSIDKRHLVCTVIGHELKGIRSVMNYVHSIDFIGLNSYAQIGAIESDMKKLNYSIPYMITEWGPTGFWEVPVTEWDAPYEETGEEKRAIFEYRYNNYIKDKTHCMGSFVFFWSQKEERTPTWYSMFVERDVAGLPLKGEKTPMVEAMKRVWQEREPEQTAPVVHSFTINNSPKAITAESNTSIEGQVEAVDKEGDHMTYIWEVLKEATEVGIGGSFEPRPERVGNVAVTEANSYSFQVSQPGNYRLYVYVSDNAGYVSTANLPFRIK